MRGRVWIFGDNVSTDAIIPGRFMDQVGVISDDQWAKVCFVDFKPQFAKNVVEGDFIFAGKNFGTGSSREVAPISIKKAGISCIIAQSFARIFYRNCINLGLYVLTAGPELLSSVEPLKYVDIDLERGLVRVEKTLKVVKIEPISPFAKEIVDNGGLLDYALKNNKHCFLKE